MCQCKKTQDAAPADKKIGGKRVIVHVNRTRTADVAAKDAARKQNVRDVAEVAIVTMEGLGASPEEIREALTATRDFLTWGK